MTNTKKNKSPVALTDSAAENLQHAVESLVSSIKQTAKRKKDIILFGHLASKPEEKDSLDIQILLMLRDEFLLSSDDPEQRARCMALMVKHVSDIENRSIKTGQVSASVLTSLARLRQLQDKLEMEKQALEQNAMDAQKIVAMSTEELERLANGQVLDVEPLKEGE
jgi:hypothetical protein